MADHTQDEYKPVKFYAENSNPKKAGFSKFKHGDSYYFCRYVDSKITLLSQAYTGQPGRDNGIESVKKNEKMAKRYRFEKRGKSGYGFGLKAGNGQEIAISPDLASEAEAYKMASRLSGASFASNATVKTAAPKKPAAKKPAAKKGAPKKAPAKTASFTSKDSRVENYRALSFYRTNGNMAEGFNSFEKDGAHYFHYVEDGKIVLISESYTSKGGRDNGVASVKKNMVLKSSYQHHTHKNGKHYFDINAANKQEIATSRWYSSGAAAQSAAAKLRGETSKSRKANEEDNYPPLAFYRKQTKGKKKGFEKFKGSDGEFYFTYFDDSKLTLISEGYPTAVIRDVGLESVRKNMKIEKRYVQGTGADGKPGFILRAGNHKEIARSVGYGSAAAAVAGAAYLMGTRRRPVAAKAKATTNPKTTTAASKKSTVVKKQPKAKTKTAAKTAAPLAAAGAAAATGLGATKAKPKVTNVKKVSVPVKAAEVKPSPKPVGDPVGDKGASIPVKAAAVVAAPIAAAAIGAAAIVTPKAEPKAAAIASAPIEAVAPVTATSAAPVAATTGRGAGIWGWLKWLLLALLALFAILFLLKTCVGGSKEVATAAPVVTESAAPAAVMVSCWNGSEAKDEASCPAKITCWDNSFATSDAACPVKPVAKDFECWDGTKAIGQAGCPVKPAPVSAQQTSAKMTAPSVAGRVCGSSPSVLFDVRNSTPISVGRLGTNPQFGDSTGYTSDEFFRRLQVKYRTSPRDKSFLDLLAKSLGYGAFHDMDASMFSEDRLEQGTSGLLGFGAQHALQYSTLNVTDPTHLDAFKVRSVNGTDVHFMKRCGNFMYVCQPQR